MTNERIINSNIDTDLYKLTMGQGTFHRYSKVGAGYEYIDRGKATYPDLFDVKLQDQIEMMAEISLRPEEKRFLLEGINGVLTPDFVDWFAGYHFNPDEVTIKRENGGLAINIDGPWQRTIYWEVPLMATISELFFKEADRAPDANWEKRCLEKALAYQKAQAKLAEFGTRRRFSYAVQDRVVEIFKEHGEGWFLGTSNIDLARKHGVPAVGTFAHEWVMAHAGMFGPLYANKIAMEVWADEFKGKLATALTDTLTTEVFLRNLDKRLATIYQSFRQDSGSPEYWTDKQIVPHLKSLGIDPLTKTGFYSDALNKPRVLEIQNHVKNEIRPGFGVGTDNTNDVGVTPLNMVIKLHHIVLPDGQRIGVCKFSDTPGKVSGDPTAIKDWTNQLGLKGGE